MDEEKAKSAPPEITKTIYEILSNFFFNLESYRVLNEHISSLKPNNSTRPLWIVFSNNCLMMAAVEWCKVFGSERNNKTYYTNCIEELDGIENIANDMKEFRDKYIAHSDFYNKPVPIMEKAVNVVRQFDKAMIAKYGLDNQETTEDVISAYREDIRRRFALMVTGKECSIS